MGVPGLMTYVSQNAKVYLKKYELSDCYLVMDGSNIANLLARDLRSNIVFGGDYDEYFTLVRSFLLALKKCNVYPIVLLDGGCDKKKMKVRLNRRKEKVKQLRSFCNGFSGKLFLPLFVVQVFIDAVRDMGFICVQCDFEADREITAVAKQLNFSVLSNDSDFFIYDVDFIPFNTLNLTPVKYSYSDKYYMECSICNAGEFSKAVGLQKPLLPIFATLLDNDQIESIIFYNFFNHVIMTEDKNKSFNLNKIIKLIEWFKNKDLNTAINNILSQVDKRDAEKVSKIFVETINNYKTFIISEGVSNELTSKFGEIHLEKKDLDINWPPEIAKLLPQTMIPGFLINMTFHQMYLTPLQVENICNQSSHLKSLNLIRKIYAMLMPYLKAKKPLLLYLVLKGQYTNIEMKTGLSDYINLDEVLKQPWKERLKLFCDTVGIPMDDLKFVPPNSWAVFIMSLIYWAKEFSGSVSLVHIHAFVIMMIANQIVQSKVGYYRNILDFRNDFKYKCNLKETKLIKEEGSDFEKMLAKVTHSECFVVQEKLIFLRNTTEEGSGRECCLPTIHLFNCFQSCLYYIMVINGLLNFPLPHLKIGDFYSGTLLFNLYINIKSKSRVEEFGSNLFLQAPNLNKIFMYLSGKLAKIVAKDATELNWRAKPKVEEK